MDYEEVEVEGIVSVLLPEFELVQVEASNGYTLSIGVSVQGVNWRELQLGERVRCVVQDSDAPRVLAAKLIL